MRISGTNSYATMATTQRRRHSEAVGRVSSGLRVYKAADDAAGLGVATNLRTRFRSAQMVLRNITTAKSIIDTAESGTGELTDMLQRMRELAVQSASETLSDDERAYLGDEYDELMDEIDRVVSSTRWGDLPLLTSGRIDLILAIMPTGGAVPVAQLEAAMTAMETNLESEGYDVGLGLAVIGDGAFGDSSDSANAITELGAASFSSDLLGLATATSTSSNPWLGVGQVIGQGTHGTDVTAGEDADEIEWRAGSQSRNIVTIQTGGPANTTAFGTEPAALADAATVALAAIGDGVAIHRLGDVQNGGLSSGTGAIRINGTLNASTIDTFISDFEDSVRAQIEPSVGSVQVGLDEADINRIDFMPDLDLTTTGLQIDDTEVDTRAGALSAMDAIDAAIDTVNSFNSTLGASFNRLDSAYNNLSEHSVAMQSSESAIRDLDMAAGTSEMAAAKILADASLAALAQAQRAEQGAIVQLIA